MKILVTGSSGHLGEALVRTLRVAGKQVTGLNADAPKIVRLRVPDYLDIYQDLGWKMFDRIDRVYVNLAARTDLGWNPRYDFAHVLESLRTGNDPRSAMTDVVGLKGYHDQVFEDGPYPTDE
jgi:UDP-glucose 4-epimerase